MAEKRSKVANLANLGYKCCLILGIAALLIAYADANVKKDSAGVKAKVKRGAKMRRQRSVDLDDLVEDLSERVDSLDQRFNNIDAAMKNGVPSDARSASSSKESAESFGFAGSNSDKGSSDDPESKKDAGLRDAHSRMGPKRDPSYYTYHNPDSTGSATYVRWGKSSCPNVYGTTIVYSGVAAGQWYDNTGGMSNTLCLHLQPTYAKYSDTIDTLQWIQGVEYEVSAFNPFSRPLHNREAPCSVCRAASRGSQVMIPGRNICPDGWTTEYKGYLMSANFGHKGRSTAVCVDGDAEARPGTHANKDRSLWFLIQAECRSLKFSSELLLNFKAVEALLGVTFCYFPLFCYSCHMKNNI